MRLLIRIFSINRAKINVFSTGNPATDVSVDVAKKSIRQKWVNFWKMLFRDYKEVLGDTAEKMREHPLKSSIWFSVLGFAFTCCSLNPDEIHYRESIVNKSNEMIFIGKPIRNPSAEEYLNTIELHYNRNQIKRISFGLFSVIIYNHKTETSGLFKDNCKYVQPTYLEIVKNNVIDIGFWNKWWILETKMTDYDVNPNEWPSTI